MKSKFFLQFNFKFNNKVLLKQFKAWKLNFFLLLGSNFNIEKSLICHFLIGSWIFVFLPRLVLVALVSYLQFFLHFHTLTQWSGFKNLENITFIYKPDQMKIETLIVHGPCIFSAFAISIFAWVEAPAQFFVKKMPRNLSKFSKKLRNRTQVESGICWP